MSGGHFNHNQSQIRDIYETLEEELKNQGKEKSRDELWMREEYYQRYPEEKFNPIYREDVQQVFKEGIEALKKAYVYAQRIDWYLSGDDGEDSLIRRLKEDLEKIK